jgi:hypothetical protein
MKQSRYVVAIVSSLLIAATALHCRSSASGGALDHDTSRWAWLGENGGTYWYVPPENLQAIQWDTEAPSAYASVDDQTVWHIQRYDNGYFFGPVVVKFAGYPRLCQYMIGSITPGGRVYISFNAVQAIPLGSPSITTGTGQMVRQSGAWTFNMQMASGSSSIQVAHWAFMRQCTPDQPCWNDLPGTERSIPELLAQCDRS